MSNILEKHLLVAVRTLKKLCLTVSSEMTNSLLAIVFNLKNLKQSASDPVVHRLPPLLTDDRVYLPMLKFCLSHTLFARRV